MFCINFQPTQKLHWCKVSHWYSWYLYFSKKLLFRFQPKEIVASHLDLRLTKYISPCEILCTSICVLLGAKCGFIVDCSKYFCFDVIKQLINAILPCVLLHPSRPNNFSVPHIADLKKYSWWNWEIALCSNILYAFMFLEICFASVIPSDFQ